jgi:hypothetical protein
MSPHEIGDFLASVVANGPYVEALGEQLGRGFAKGLADDPVATAAPDMLATLKAVAKWCHGGHGCFPAAQCGLCAPVLRAIAKAEGRS